MKFDTVIIGGGLAGLTCGIKLAEAGQKCAIVSSGQSALHFFSGSFDLLNFNRQGAEVTYPLEEMINLSDHHPYKRMGIDRIKQLLPQVQPLLENAGLHFQGNAEMNHYVVNPMGKLKPTWLTIDDFSIFDPMVGMPWKKIAILNISGFLDFHTRFVASGLEASGIEVQVKHFAMDSFEEIRHNPSEMRSTNIAKIFDKETVIDEFIERVNELSEGFESVLLPAVFGLFNPSVVGKIKLGVNKPLCLVPAIPPSVPGIRSQISLSKRFQALGGKYFLGDTVDSGVFENNRLISVNTVNQGDISLIANSFVLATGGFISQGLVASPDNIYDPVFDLDVICDKERTNWVDKKIFNKQPFMYYGVDTDDRFHATKEGKSINNLYVVGAILSGANSLKEGSGAGVSLLTALHVSNCIIKEDSK